MFFFGGILEFVELSPGRIECKSEAELQSAPLHMQANTHSEDILLSLLYVFFLVCKCKSSSSERTLCDTITDICLLFGLVR